MSELHLDVDNAICAGHGRCYSLHPELFESDDAGYPVVLQRVVSDDNGKGAQDALDNCPEGAIRLGRTAAALD